MKFYLQRPLQVLALCTVFSFVFTSCSDDETTEDPNTITITADTEAAEKHN